MTSATPESEDNLGLFNDETPPASEVAFEFDSPARSPSQCTTHDGSSLLNVHLVPPGPTVAAATALLLTPAALPAAPAASSTAPTARDGTSAATSPDDNGVVASSQPVPGLTSPATSSDVGNDTLLPSQRSHDQLDEAFPAYVLNDHHSRPVANQILAKHEEGSSIVLHGDAVTEAPDGCKAHQEDMDGTSLSPVKAEHPISEAVQSIRSAPEDNAITPPLSASSGGAPAIVKRKAAADSGPGLANMQSLAASGGARVSGLSKRSTEAARSRKATVGSSKSKGLAVEGFQEDVIGSDPKRVKLDQ